MKHTKPLLLSGMIILCGISGCRSKIAQKDFDRFCKNELPVINRQLTRVLVADVFTPPVCSRIYAYCNIAAYEALRPSDKSYPTYAGQLKGLKAIPQPAAQTQYCYPVASIIAFTTIAQKLVYNSDSVKVMEDNYLNTIKNMGIEPTVAEASVQYGRQVGNAVLNWAKQDGYLQRNAHPGYTVTKKPGRWVPTPPDYMDDIEPNWNTMRPFTLDSVSQFEAVPPTKYDTVKNSAFYKEAYQVYSTCKSLDQPKTAIAKFWDCNPNVSYTQGHVLFFLQKISPGGHWVHVACVVCQKEQFTPIKTAMIVSKVAITIADAFISCWSTKSKYSLLRPETYINKYIDKDWKPLLQTPPFPEYVSGHSVVSASAANVLTRLVGSRYAYTDSTEVPFGIPQRTFKSFNEAANEACISRLYGGIHFLRSIENGKAAGNSIGEFAMKKLK